MVGPEGLQNASARGINTENQEYAYPHGFINTVNQDYAYPNGLNSPSICEMPSQMETFMSPSNSSSSTFNAAPMMGEMDKVSSVVSMLKGTLERKKLNSQIENEVLEDESSNGIFPSREAMFNASFNQPLHEKHLTFQEVSPIQVKDCGVVQMIDGSMDHDLEGFVNSVTPIQSGRVSQEPSQSESSAAAPVLSSGFEACDGPTNSGQTISVSESSRKQSRKSPENGSRAKGTLFEQLDIREFIEKNMAFLTQSLSSISLD